MTTPDPSAELLLRSVLAEVLPPEREANLLATTLQEVTRQRRRRGVRQRVVTVAVLVGMASWTAWWWPRRVPVGPVPSVAVTSASPAGVTILASQPLAPAYVIETRLGATPQVHSDAHSAAWVETAAEERRAAYLTDEELLELLAGKPAALVKSGGETRLVLAALGGETGSRPDGD